MSVERVSTIINGTEFVLPAKAKHVMQARNGIWFWTETNPLDQALDTPLNSQLDWQPTKKPIIFKNKDGNATILRSSPPLKGVDNLRTTIIQMVNER